MKGHMRHLAAAAFLIVASFAPINSVAYAEVGNGEVSIQLEDASTELSTVSLGDRIERSFLIKSNSGDCFIRLRADLVQGDLSDSVDYLQPEENGWFLANDGWWYLTSPLTSGEASCFTSSFVIDGSEPFVTRNLARSAVNISEIVTANAIQAADFDPDWTSDSPWEASGPGEEIPRDEQQVVIGGSDPPSTGEGDGGYVENDFSPTQTVGLDADGTSSDQRLVQSEVQSSDTKRVYAMTSGLPQTGDGTLPIHTLVCMSVICALTLLVLLLPKRSNIEREGGELCNRSIKKKCL